TQNQRDLWSDRALSPGKARKPPEISGECRMSQIRIPPSFRGFRVMVIVPPKPVGFQSTRARERDRRLLQRRRQRLRDRIAPRPPPESGAPMITAATIRYELGRRTHGLAPGGVGALLLVARRTGLIAAIDRRLHLLKRHLPYFESDHVLNIAFNL